MESVLTEFDVSCYAVYCVLVYSHVQLKELNHNNIKAFIGACVEPGHICYLMQICSRGSVQVTRYQNHKLACSSITYSVWRGAVMVTVRDCGR